jgi:photosystem II stability/assembly factor-like uncharacterized protein
MVRAVRRADRCRWILAAPRALEMVLTVAIVLTGCRSYVGRTAPPEQTSSEAAKLAIASSDDQLPQGIFRAGKSPILNVQLPTGKDRSAHLQFVDQKTGYFSGGSQIWSTHDSGSKWEVVSDFRGKEVEDLQFADAQYGWGLVDDGAYERGAVWRHLYETSDGGRRWERLPQPETLGFSGLTISRLALLSNNLEGWVGGAEYRPITDREKKEEDLPSTRLSSGHEQGLCVAIYHSNDRGRTWQRQQAPRAWGYLNDLFILDSTHGWACGLWLSLRLAGDHWRIIEEGSHGKPHCLAAEAGAPTIEPKTVYFLNQKLGWVSNSNGYVGRSTNGGLSWSDICNLQPDRTEIAPYFTLIHFCTPLIGFALNTEQILWRTEDGGATWRPIPIDDRIAGAYFLDSENGWAVGNNNTYRIQVSSVR